MWNPFKASLPVDVRSGVPAEYGYPGEHFPYPMETVVVDEANYPDELNTEDNSPESWRSVVGDRWPSAHPDYDRPYHREFENAAGTVASDVPSVSPAVGSTDLAFPRERDGVPGTNRLIGGVGPVTGEDSQWSGHRADLHTPTIGNAGPVTGGPDYSSQLAAAFFQQQAALYSQQYAESAMVSAV